MAVRSRDLAGGRAAGRVGGGEGEADSIKQVKQAGWQRAETQLRALIPICNTHEIARVHVRATIRARATNSAYTLGLARRHGVG